jgi:hypothetical protein
MEGKMYINKLAILTLFTVVFINIAVAHNEYYKLQNNQMVITTTVSEAIKWDNYTNLPIWIQFTETTKPSELVLEDILYDFREVLNNKWNVVTNSCVSFTETDPNPNEFGDQIQINFTTTAGVFAGSPAGVEYTGAVTSFCINNNKFVVTATNPQYGSYSAILYNSCTARMFIWGRNIFEQGKVNFTHVSLHELGHVIGLNHCTASGDPVMDNVIYLTTVTPRAFLTWADEEGLQTLCSYVTDVNDYIWIEKYLDVLNVNQFYYMPAQAHFVDLLPYGNYITQWGNWQITASSSCGDITVYDMPYGSITVPTLPNGYYWNRDANGYVVATLSITGIDNDGDTHSSSTTIKIGNVPNTFITSGTLASDTHWCGEVIITGNITVPSGITLYVLPGAVVKFPNNTSLIVQGKLDARMCTFTAQSGTSQGSWGSISLSGSGAASSELDAVAISYGTRVEAINTSNILIHGCYILNTYDGVRFSGSTGSILNNTITTNSIGHGIIVENSSNVTCNQNDVTKTSNPRSGVGILFRSGSNGTVW